MSGASAFVEGLTQLGYTPRALPGMPDHVVIDYVVLSGCFEGACVKLGFIVPPDFPITPPSGPHTSPCLRPSDQPGEHPNGARHTHHAQPFAQAEGGAWQYWSRPFPNWAPSKSPVGTYMTFIDQLWRTQ
jgi:hypothetical protein